MNSNRVTLPGKARRALTLIDPAFDVVRLEDQGDNTELVEVVYGLVETGIRIWRAPVGFCVNFNDTDTMHQQMFEATAHACRLARAWLHDWIEANAAAAPPLESATSPTTGTHITVPVGLLIACYHALQSYVYGNSAPALAKACADELAPHLPPSAGARQA